MSIFDEDTTPKFRARNDGTDHRKKKEKEKEPEYKAKKIIHKSTKFALRPSRMFFKQEERDMYAEYFNRFRSDLEEAYGTFTTAQEILVDCLCYAVVRLERKSRLESHFGRFFDRVAPHDPLGQIQSTLKSLGLLPEKKEKESANGASEIKKLLAKDSESPEPEISLDGYDEWLANRNVPQIEVRTPEKLPRYEEEDLILNEDDEEEEI
jgi:hypothetical protein